MSDEVTTALGLSDGCGVCLMCEVAVNFCQRAKRSVAIAPWIAAVILAFIGGASVCSASILYDGMPGVQLDGNTVKYEQVIESSVTDPEPLYGAPLVTGDSIDFNPVLFGSLSKAGTIDDTKGL